MILANVDRTLFELIRVGIVSAGYLPDITVIGTEEAYKAAKEAIVTGGKQVIELFGVSGAKNRDARSVNKIVIDRKSIEMGNLGATGIVSYIKNQDNTFKKVKLPDRSSHVKYEIRAITDSTEYERIMYDIIMEAVGYVKETLFFNEVNSTFTGAENIFYEHEGQADVSSENLIEKLYRFSAIDVWLQQDKLMKADVPTLNTVEFILYGMELDKAFDVDKADFKVENLEIKDNP